jgi:hypothetical protein
LSELTRPEALRLLGLAPIGRIVYTVRALPAIVPACHLVDSGMVVVRTHIGSECTGAVVAYQADAIDPIERVGWTVTVTGVARRILDADEIALYEDRLTPLVKAEGVEVIRIYPEIVTGHELVAH